jgi:putative ABC transport system permease protein
MTAGEALRSAMDNLAAHKLRSTLSMLGMIFGVGAVIAMLSIGGGAERQAMEMIDRMGVRNVLVRSKEPRDEEAQEVRKKSLGVSPRDAQAILEGVPGAELAVPRLEVTVYKVLAAEAKTDAKVFGVSWRQADLTGLAVAEGRFLDARDEREHAQVCVIGPAARRDLFGYGPALGSDLKINDVWFEVVGVLEDTGGAATFQGVALGSPSREIYVPVTTAMRKFDRDPI